MSEEEKTQEKAPLHILGFRAENVKRIKLVALEPNGRDVVTIGGKNAQGKTSLLDAIEMALAGAAGIPGEPVRRGKSKGKVELDFGEFVVTRILAADGKHKLEVRGADGLELAAPQTVLDALTAKVCFDPLSFAREEPKKQDKVLRELVGLDTKDLDERHAEVTARRKELNRDVKRLEVSVQQIAFTPGLPAKEVSVTELVAELEARNATIAANAITRQIGVDLEKEMDDVTAAMTAMNVEITELETKLARCRENLANLDDSKKDLVDRLVENEQTVLQLFDPDTTAVKQQIKDAESTNTKIRLNLERKRVDDERRRVQDQSDDLTTELREIEAQKAARLAAIKFPVPGLGFDETGPTFNGIPLAQASQAERIRVSVAIGAALNPRIRVMLVRDASLLDDDGMELLHQLAHETKSQIWLERVGTGDPTAIIIEDGMVLDAEETAS